MLTTYRRFLQLNWHILSINTNRVRVIEQKSIFFTLTYYGTPRVFSIKLYILHFWIVIISILSRYFLNDGIYFQCLNPEQNTVSEDLYGTYEYNFELDTHING